jgi:hypothetical protein
MLSYNQVWGKSKGDTLRVTCRQAQRLMSPFIDSMATPDEVEQVETHVSGCEPCQRQLQSYISVRNLLRCVEDPAIPADLTLETRVRLSRERNSARLCHLRTRLENCLKPIAVPALMGTFITALSFALLLGDLAAHPVIADDGPSTTPIALYKRVRTTDRTLSRFASEIPDLTETVTADVLVSGTGRMISYTVLSGPSDPLVDLWLRKQLYYAEFTPANLFGRPVNSRIIVSFIGVRS